MKKIEDLRKTYNQGMLDLQDLTSDPMDLFRHWWHKAIEAKIEESNAMTLATVDRDGHPSARIVLLKGLSEDGFEFYTNYESRKAKEMEENNHVALLFFWKELERQVRIEGIVEKLSKEQSEKYFKSRPRGSQVGAWSSPQSLVIPDRTVLEENVRKTEEKFGELDPLPLPEFWGGYMVRAVQYEFWQGRMDRLHDRFRYTKHLDGKSWIVERLAP